MVLQLNAQPIVDQKSRPQLQTLLSLASLPSRRSRSRSSAASSESSMSLLPDRLLHSGIEWNWKAARRLALTGPTSVSKSARNASASDDTSWPCFSTRFVYAGWTIRVFKRARWLGGGTAMAFVGGLRRDIPAPRMLFKRLIAPVSVSAC